MQQEHRLWAGALADFSDQDQGQQNGSLDTTDRDNPSSSGPHFPILLSPGWRVVSDALQWKLQTWRSPRWRDTRFCVSKSGLLQCINECVGPNVDPRALAQIRSLPEWHPDRERRRAEP